MVKDPRTSKSVRGRIFTWGGSTTAERRLGADHDVAGGSLDVALAATGDLGDRDVLSEAGDVPRRLAGLGVGGVDLPGQPDVLVLEQGDVIAVDGDVREHCAVGAVDV